jgi:serine/threonine protein phosphatase PrpC
MSTIRVRAASTFTSKGARPAQEDHALSVQEKGIFVVADGFGGPLPGAQASKTACEAVRSFLVKEAGDREATLPFVLRSYFSLAGNVLFNALVHANHKVGIMNKGKDVHERGGASVLAGYLDGDLLALANVGGCTAWMLRQGKGAELVTPRTYGRLCNPFESDHGEELKVPLMALGMTEDLEPEIFEYRVRAGDWLLFHTDGLTAELRARIAAIQLRGLPPAQAAEEVISLLNQGSFQDNLACSLVVF